jgi:hypothetical protein
MMEHRHLERVKAIEQELNELQAKINGLKSERIDLFREGIDFKGPHLEDAFMNYVQTYAPVKPSTLFDVFALRLNESEIRTMMWKLNEHGKIAFDNNWSVIPA